MRTIFASLVLASLAINPTWSQDAKKKTAMTLPGLGPIKADFSYFEFWGLKPKSVTLDYAGAQMPDKSIMVTARLTYVLQFERDAQSYDLDALQRAFAPPNRKLRHLFFDEENVAIQANMILEHKIQGTVSGVTGEAFRIIIEFPVTPELQQTKKLVVRPG